MDEALKPYTPVLLYTHMFTGLNTCLTSHKVIGAFSSPEKRFFQMFLGIYLYAYVCVDILTYKILKIYMISYS